MALTGTLPELTTRSHDATWNRSRWDALPADGNRYEVVDGVLYLSTAPSFFHQWVVRQTLLALHEQVDRPGLGTTIMAPIGVFMPGCDPVQPDLLVVSAADRGAIRGGRIEGVPALLVEVQSPSSVGYDDRVKRPAYARAGVPEYWIVRPATRDVLVCTRPDATLGDFAQSQLVAPGEELISPTLPVRLRIDAIFADAPDATL
jgi:Uma2 family endonuclease